QQQPTTALSESELLRRVDTYANRTLSLVDGFIQLARAETADLSSQDLDLAELLAQCCDEFWAQARQRQIDLRYDEPDAPAWVNGDPSLLRRAFGNLLDNAIKYSPHHTEIVCSITLGQGCWVVAIQ